ncbi:hypothetical protein, partial [Haloferax sp. ATB1]|uniref:hypothetical protein n=1 Tax=Haloferax sp. ATB1 TaxID=1508454 RepID=UPI001F529253
RTTLGVDLASAAALAVAGSPSRPSCSAALRQRSATMSSPASSCWASCTGLLQLAACGVLSFPHQARGRLRRLWLVGVSFDIGPGHLLMWVLVA